MAQNWPARLGQNSIAELPNRPRYAESAGLNPGLGSLRCHLRDRHRQTPLAQHRSSGLLSWVRLCNGENVGKRQFHRPRNGAPWRRVVLIQCVWVMVRKLGNSYQAQFRRLRHQRGLNKASCAAGPSILTAIDAMPRDGADLQRPRCGPLHRSPMARAHGLVRQITKFGYTCTLTPQQALREARPLLSRYAFRRQAAPNNHQLNVNVQ